MKASAAAVTAAAGLTLVAATSAWAQGGAAPSSPTPPPAPAAEKPASVPAKPEGAKPEGSKGEGAQPGAAAGNGLAPLEGWPEKAISSTTTASGVVIEEYKIGTGNELKEGASLVAHYRGSLKADGKEFDSSYKRGTPIPAPLWGLIKGWGEGLVGMKAGGMRKITIPYALAYGEQGRPPTIPEKADLVFEVELVDAMVIEELKVGDGEEVQPNATVTCHYRGTLKSDGTEFDSSYSRGEPATFGLRQVIKGWTFGVPHMKVGGKRKLVIPWQLAYGERGSPPKIGPKADLVFEIEVMAVQNPPAPPPAASSAK